MIRVRGFSLLELLIVLAVMAGLAAIVFPSLTRPLAENEVGRAAADLRDAISECRSDAVLQQELRLIRFEANSPLVTWGDWQSLTADVLEMKSSDLPVADAEGSRASNSLRLPDGIVIEQVLSGDAEILQDVGVTSENQSWYLPCLPTGQTKDCQVVLRDQLSRARCVLRIDGVLRMMRVERIQNAEDASIIAGSQP